MIAEEIRSTSTTPSLNPNREIGLGFLNDFVPKTRNRHYARDRNYELGPGNHLSVSRLSAWLRCRLVTEEEVIRTVIGEHGYASADKFVQEVFWRIYFKGWLEQHPATWAGYRAELNRQSSLLRLDDRLEAQYTKATLARTGIECFDSWVRELKNTGYLHNHARMWFASIWVFTLNLPWQLGADFFHRHLVDGDAASNTLSWRWVCGLHTPGKHYLARAENINRYTRGKFNPAGQLNETAGPLTMDAVAPLVPLQIQEKGHSGRYGLVVTSENCDLGSILLEGNPSAILGVSVSSNTDSPAGPGLRAEFLTGAVEGVINQLAESLDVPCAMVAAEDFQTLIPEWFRDHDLDCIRCAYQPVGEFADLLGPVRQTASSDGIPWQFYLSRIDHFSWPHATAGFFKLRKKIPDILCNLQVQCES